MIHIHDRSRGDQASAPGATGAARRAEVAAGLAAVRTRIDRACAESGRDPSEVTLVAVTKFFPPSDLRLLADLGVHDVGENRDQEARAKFADPVLDGVQLTRHFIGQLQTNKATSVVGYADVVHTVDRLRLASALGRAAEVAGRTLRVLVQVSLDEPGTTQADPGGLRGGVAVQELDALAEAVSSHTALELGGLMAVAPLDGDPDVAFARLWEAARRIQERYPGADWVSAGMSGDLEAAVRHGATHLRVGSAILGPRPALR